LVDFLPFSFLTVWHEKIYPIKWEVFPPVIINLCYYWAKHEIPLTRPFIIGPCYYWVSRFFWFLGVGPTPFIILPVPPVPIKKNNPPEGGLLVIKAFITDYN